jgi:hypothetical protein
MTKYPIREPFNDLEYKNRQNSYKKLLIDLYQKDNTFDDDTPVSLKDIYTPLKLGYEEKTDNTYYIEETICKHQFIAISGVAGSGKSTITKYLSISTAENGVNETIKKVGKRIVLPFILRELDFNKINSFDELFSQWINNINKNSKNILDREFFEFYIKKGWAIIIFDGFDEIGIEKNKNLIKWLDEYIESNKLNKQTDIKTNIIITGRPTGFLNGVKYDTFFQKLYLQQYNQEQIKIYTKNYFSIKYSHQKNKIEEKSQVFLERLDKFEDLKQLKIRPIYLMMLAHISENKGELPKTRTLAYQQMIESYIHILDKQKELYEKQHDKKLPQWDLYDKTILLEELAYKIHTKANKEIEKANILKRSKSQLQIQVSSSEVLEYLKEIVKDSRFRSINKNESVEKILDYYLARTGLLIKPQEGYIQFSHLSFQEYLTASKIYRDKDDLDLINYLNTNIFNTLHQVGFEEVAQLYFGIDSLIGGKNQFKITKLLFKNDIHYHIFIYNLIFLTDNRLKEYEEIEWLQNLIYIWINSNKISSFYKLIKNLYKDLSNHKNKEFYEKIKKFFFDITNQILNDNINFKPIENIEIENINNINQLTNTLYIGFYFKEFRENFLTKSILDKFPKEIQNSNFQFWLDKYIPYNKELKVDISNIVINNTSPLLFIQLNGSYFLTFSPLFTNNSLYKNLLKIQLIINKNTIFLLTQNLLSTKIKNMARDMARDMARARSMAMAIDMARARAMDMAMAMAMDMAMDMAMTMDMDMARAMAMANASASDKVAYQDIINLGLKSWLFSLCGSSKLFAKKVGIDIGISKEEYKKLYDKLNNKNSRLKYFKDCKLTDTEKNQIEELFEESYLLKTMKYTLENTKYEEFDEQKVINDFHNDIKEFNKKYKDYEI